MRWCSWVSGKYKTRQSRRQTSWCIIQKIRKEVEWKETFTGRHNLLWLCVIGSFPSQFCKVTLSWDGSQRTFAECWSKLFDTCCMVHRNMFQQTYIPLLEHVFFVFVLYYATCTLQGGVAQIKYSCGKFAIPWQWHTILWLHSPH